MYLTVYFLLSFFFFSSGNRQLQNDQKWKEYLLIMQKKNRKNFQIINYFEKS